jgi:hypothetical protein
MSQPHQYVALQDFFRWESQSRVEMVGDVATDKKCSFMPQEILRSYFTVDGIGKISQILSEVFQSEDFPVHPSLILRGHLAVFCVLLRIGKGTYIEHFAHYEELSDQRLPFDQDHSPACFPSAEGDPMFLQRFCENQCMYCVPTFDSHMLHMHFGRQRLLPITEQKVLERRGNAIKYRVKLYGPYNKLLPAESEMVSSSADPPMPSASTSTNILSRLETPTLTRSSLNNILAKKTGIIIPKKSVGFEA